MEVNEYRDKDLNERLVHQIAMLAARSFGPSSRSVEQRVADMMESLKSDDPEVVSGRRFVVFNDDEQMIAHARTFVRDIKSESDTFSVLALATVCSDPDLRGQGLGLLVTKAAFQLVGTKHWPSVSLFQTPVPLFYEKLNSRIVDNRFVNRQSGLDPNANPWRDDTIMIYPATHTWPSGTIDLNGPDY